MTLTTVNPALLDTQAQYTGFKNRLINGQMVIDQRNAGASVVGSGSKQYILDRWAFWTNGGAGSAAFTVQRSSTAPTGFSNSMLITQTAAYSPVAGSYSLLSQYIEGYNVADLGWGTASAATVTLSFLVRSSLTGTFGGAVSNNAQDRSYPFTYTISAANTWETKTVVVPGDTSGTWLTTNSTGIQLYWQLGVGSTYLGAAGSWAGATYLGATGATNFTATNGATFYITGVQLEKGSTATSFDYRPYGTELGLCQRYYEFGQNSSAGGHISAAGVSLYSMTCYKATKRSTVTFTTTNCQSQASGGTVTNRTFSTSANDTQGFSPQLSGSDPVCYVTWQASAEL